MGTHPGDASEARDATAVVDGLRAYYARRAAYYERVYHKPERQADLRAMEAAFGTCLAGRDVLEVACGTGWWTQNGAHRARSWLATDVNDETLAVARTKPMPPQVGFCVVDAYTLEGLEGQGFDAAFAGCWWSHVPLRRLRGWLALLHTRLVPGARIVMLDNRYVEGNSTPVSRRDSDGNTYQIRTLDDGSVQEVLKTFPSAEQAFALLGPRARAPRWTDHAHYWVLDYTLA